MKEYEIYLPALEGNGNAVDPSLMERIKRDLKNAFGGYTHLQQRNEGAWKMGGITFREEVTILRILDDGSANFDMQAFKRELERDLKQQTVLIVSRTVEVL